MPKLSLLLKHPDFFRQSHGRVIGPSLMMQLWWLLDGNWWLFMDVNLITTTRNFLSQQQQQQQHNCRTLFSPPCCSCLFLWPLSLLNARLIVWICGWA